MPNKCIFSSNPLNLQPVGTVADPIPEVMSSRMLYPSDSRDLQIRIYHWVATACMCSHNFKFKAMQTYPYLVECHVWHECLCLFCSFNNAEANLVTLKMQAACSSKLAEHALYLSWCKNYETIARAVTIK
jgi:hypothetical protein